MQVTLLDISQSGCSISHTCIAIYINTSI